jgi:membrane protein DedA with SNARE-associated domain
MFAFQITASIGLPLIFVLVMCETAGVLPMSPGEVAAISGGIEAADHKLTLAWVIVAAASGAIVGDNIGYLIGRIGGRRLLEARGPFARQRRRTLEVADPFFARHGGIAVFYGRWLPVLRVFASWFAGGTKMRWRLFVVWNALGGITWALSMVLLGYYVGTAAKSLMNDVGSLGMVLIIVSIVALVITRKVVKRRRARAAEAAADGEQVLPLGGQPTVASPAVPEPAQPTVAASVIPAGQRTVASLAPTAAQRTVARPRPGPDEATGRE